MPKIKAAFPGRRAVVRTFGRLPRTAFVAPEGLGVVQVVSVLGGRDMRKLVYARSGDWRELLL